MRTLDFRSDTVTKPTPEMLARLRAENPGPYTGEEVEAVFRALFEASLALKRRAGLGGGRP